MHLLADPSAVKPDHNLASWNSVVKVSMQVVDEASQFAVGGLMWKCSTASELPHTVFRTVVMYTFHSSDNLVSRTVEHNWRSVVIDILRCGLAFWAFWCISICSTNEVKSSISMAWTVWALDSLDSLWFTAMAPYRCIKIIVLIRRSFLFIWNQNEFELILITTQSCNVLASKSSLTKAAAHTPMHTAATRRISLLIMVLVFSDHQMLRVDAVSLLYKSADIWWMISFQSISIALTWILRAVGKQSLKVTGT